MSAARIVALADVRVRAIEQVSHKKSAMRARLPVRHAGAAQRFRNQRGSLPHREPIDGTEMTERTAA